MYLIKQWYLDSALLAHPSKYLSTHASASNFLKYLPQSDETDSYPVAPST